MRQTIPRSSLQLNAKGMRVKCQKHLKPINALNIGLTSSLEDRILCQNCPNDGQQLLSLEFAEEHIYNWYQEGKKSISNKLHEFLNFIAFYTIQLKQVESDISQIINNISRDIREIYRKNSKYWKTLNKPQEFVISISSRKEINAQELQKLALFLSKQNVENKKLDLQERIKSSLQRDFFCISNIGKSIEKLSELKYVYSPQQSHQEQQDKSGQEINQFNNREKYFRYRDSILLCNEGSSIAISNDNKLMAISERKKINIWNLKDRIQINYLNSPFQVSKLEFSQNSNFLAASEFCLMDESCMIAIFELSSNLKWPTIRLAGHSNTINNMVFTHDSSHLVTGSNDKTLKIWDLKQQTQVYSKTFQSFVKGISFSENKKLIACGCYSGEVQIFQSKSILNLQKLFYWKTTEKILGIIIAPNNESLITYHQYGKIYIWSLQEFGKKIKFFNNIIEDFDMLTYNVKLAFSGTVLISLDENINIRHIQTSQILNSIKVIERQFEQMKLAISSDLKHILVVGAPVIQIYERIEN